MNLRRARAGNHHPQRAGQAAGAHLDVRTRRNPDPDANLGGPEVKAQAPRGHGSHRYQGAGHALWRRDQRPGHRGLRQQPGRGLDRQPHRDLQPQPRRGLLRHPRQGPYPGRGLLRRPGQCPYPGRCLELEPYRSLGLLGPARDRRPHRSGGGAAQSAGPFGPRHDGR